MSGAASIGERRQADAASKYADALAGLASSVGGRNAQLVRVALLGLLAGESAARIEQDLFEHGGEPRLSRAEVARAVRHAEGRVGTAAPARMSPAEFQRPPVPRAEEPNEREKGFVARMMAAGEGATSRTLLAESPVAVPMDPRGQAAEFVRCVFPDWREMFFAGHKTTPRTFSALYYPTGFLVRHIDKGEALPPRISANPHTGRKGRTTEGKPSFACLDTVAAYRNAVVEFDGLPLPRQVAFWTGAIRLNTLPVRSLVWSGGKSIHGLVRLAAADAAQWASRWRHLLRLLCSADDPTQRADASCRDASRMTRLPGAVNSRTGKFQALLWLAAPTPAEYGPPVWDWPRANWRQPNEWRANALPKIGAY